MYTGNKAIRVYNTHIEISPYHKGENMQLENYLSEYVFLSKWRHYEPVAYYIEDDTLYVPRGLSVQNLEATFNSLATVSKVSNKVKKINYPGFICTATPRDDIQDNAMEFLLCRGRFKAGRQYNQFHLNLDTGDGKTMCMLMLVATFGAKAIIVTHRKNIKEQWKETFSEYTNLPSSELVDISGDKFDKYAELGDGSVFFTTHQALTSYARKHGWKALGKVFEKIGFGVKIVDEAHINFSNTLMEDYFTNVAMNYYVTATPKRTSNKQAALYKMAFSNSYKFGSITDYEHRRKHVHFITTFYHSSPTEYDMRMCSTARGFSVSMFADYAVNENRCTQIRAIKEVYQEAVENRGRILITAGSINAIDTLYEELDGLVPGKTVGKMHSRQDHKLNEAALNADVILATPSYVGTGCDIKGLRTIINVTPIGSEILMSQVQGRLRELGPNTDTFMYHLVDTSFEDCTRLNESISKCMEERCASMEKKFIY